MDGVCGRGDTKAKVQDERATIKTRRSGLELANTKYTPGRRSLSPLGIVICRCNSFNTYTLRNEQTQMHSCSRITTARPGFPLTGFGYYLYSSKHQHSSGGVSYFVPEHLQLQRYYGVLLQLLSMKYVVRVHVLLLYSSLDASTPSPYTAFMIPTQHSSRHYCKEGPCSCLPHRVAFLVFHGSGYLPGSCTVPILSPEKRPSCQ